jgi:hypothetical protein
LHRGVQQLALPAAPVWFGVAFENHLLHPRGQGSVVILAGEGYGGSAAAIGAWVTVVNRSSTVENCWCIGDSSPTKQGA